MGRPAWLLAMAVTLGACASPSGPVEPSEAPPAASPVVAAPEIEEAAPVEPAPPRLVVHEWGTFTARVAPDGSLRKWTKRDRVEPLPKFVFESWMTDAKQAAEGTVRMETPVLYFYADEPTRMEVGVEFPGGFLTEWYPAAAHEDTAELASLRWTDVEIQPGPDPDYLVDGDSHYYAARETDANPLALTDANGRTAHEKFLFYRGVGSFALPLEGRPIKAGVELTATRPLAGVVVLRREGDSLGFTLVGELDGTQTVLLPPLDRELAELEATLAELLVAQGLYPREAAAMIATWRALWFEPGTRALYMVPRELTDATLPLSLDPAPDELVRVLVGRLDLEG